MAETPQLLLPPAFGLLLRGCYWSAKIDDISAFMNFGPLILIPTTKFDSTRNLILDKNAPEAHIMYLTVGSWFLISFVMGGGGGPSRANKFLNAPAPPLPSVYALKPPSWALVHKTTYAPIIYTALCIMFWMRAYPLLGQVGGGWALIMDMHASKTLRTGLYKS